MRVLPISAAECSGVAARALDTDEAAGVLSAEGLAASLRRAASFLCPASPRQVIDAVLDVLRPLSEGGGMQREDLAVLLDLLVAAGDLIEIRRSSDAPARLLYLGPPSYIERHPGQYLLTGIRPSGAPLISSDLADLVQHEGHTRTIELSADQAEVLLPEAGLHKIRRDHWIRRPPEAPASSLTAQMRQRLDASSPAGRVEGLTIIGQDANVTYYRGRWRPLKPTDSGLFAGRRTQAYGADAWCLVLAASSTVARLIDLPADDQTAPGHDEAWRVQAAIDAERGTPQVFAVGGAARPGGKTVDFFSPLPRWAERYLELVGMAVPRSPGALFSYRVPEAALPDLAGFLARMLWMRQSTNKGAE